MLKKFVATDDIATTILGHVIGQHLPDHQRRRKMVDRQKNSASKNIMSNVSILQNKA